MKFWFAAVVVSAAVGLGCSSDGSDGPTGPIGPTGPTGQAGATGAQGISGQAGQSVISAQLAVGSIDCPTGGIQFTSVSGTTFACNGAQGPQGVQGQPGAQGVKGDQGLTGAQGAQGAQGALGPVGPTGPSGPSGPLPGYVVLKTFGSWTTLSAPVAGSSVTLPELAPLAFSLNVGGPQEVHQLLYFVAGQDFYSGTSAKCRGAVQILSGPTGPDYTSFSFPTAWYAGDNPVNPASGVYVIAGWPSGTYYGHVVYPADCLPVFGAFTAQLMISRVQ